MKKLLLVSLAFLFTTHSFSMSCGSSSELEKSISSTKWIVNNPDGQISMIEFANNGIYKCVLDYFISNKDSMSGIWHIEGDEISVILTKSDNFKSEPSKIKIISVDNTDLIIQYDGNKIHYRSVFSYTKEEIYSKFIGTYNLKKLEGIEYDHMTFRFKDNNPKQLECVRTFRFRNFNTGKLGPDYVNIYEVIKVDMTNKNITLKYGDNQATYKFTNNQCGGYDLIVFDEVLIYSCTK